MWDERTHDFKWSPSAVAKRRARLKLRQWHEYIAKYEPYRHTYRVWRGMTETEAQQAVAHWEAAQSRVQAELRNLRRDRKYHWPDRYRAFLFQKQAELAAVQNELKVMRRVLAEANSQPVQVFQEA